MDNTKISLGTLKEHADEFCGDLIDLFQNKYNFTIDDIYFSDREDLGLSRFTEKFIQFCYTLLADESRLETRTLI